MRSFLRSSVLLAIILLVVASHDSSAQQAVLTPVKDNTLYETVDGSTSNGAGDYLFVGRVGTNSGGAKRRGLLKFDVASVVPAGATITSVTLTMNMSKAPTTTSASIGLHRVSADWGEGTSNANANEGGGAPSVNGDATWIHRVKGTSNWTSAGGDFNGSASASASVGGVGAYTWTSNAQLIADVTAWLTTPSANFGWILVGDESASGTSKRFDAREIATTATRPQLTIQYTTSTSVGETAPTPLRFELSGNYPNPFNPSTRIEFTLPSTQSARLAIYTVLGERIATLLEGPMTAGRHAVTWDATGRPSGLYFARLEAGGSTAVRRLVLTK